MNSRQREAQWWDDLFINNSKLYFDLKHQVEAEQEAEENPVVVPETEADVRNLLADLRGMGIELEP